MLAMHQGSMMETHLYGLLEDLYISVTLPDRRGSYAFHPIHRHRPLISTTQAVAREGLTRRSKEIVSTISFSPQSSVNVGLTYIANKTSSHVIPILFLTRIDHPDSI
jgi:hypothetical protein